MVSLLIALFASTSAIAADSPAQIEAKWMLSRITGVRFPDSSPVINQMATRIAAGDKLGAAAIATSQQQFLTVTIREMAAAMSTREESVRTPLNDFVAGFVGVARDDIDARQLLYGNFYYVADPARLNGLNPGVRNNFLPDMLLSNNHYSDLERANINWAEALMKVDGQMIPTTTDNAAANSSMANPDPGGLLTSRAFMAAHASAGTNRRLVEFTFREFMCTPIQSWADTLAPDVRIGRDIDRQPGGEAQVFQTTCKGCHTVMDGFRGAFALWDFNINGQGVVHALNGVTNGNLRPDVDQRGVIQKLNRNNFIQYAGGYVTTDDSFVNHANRAVNSTRFGWRGMAPDTSSFAGQATGVHAFGRLVANSQQFSRCMAKHAFETVCKHDLPEAEASALFASLGMSFEAANYNMKRLFQTVAVHPRCKFQ
jgi:hypothetical protein